MSEPTLASAVAVPDQDAIRQSPEYPAKRRKSSIAEHDDWKRRRLSQQSSRGTVSPHSQRHHHSPPKDDVGADRPSERRPAPPIRKEEDRKRGKRLFGGLLGTLSQSSSSEAQKRRADIEKRQQEKLKSQANEYDGLKKKRTERRDFIRKKETPFYEREAMRTRHDNMRAAARFLKTRTEPSLYWKPWQYRSGDEAVIQDQTTEAESVIVREVAEFEARYPPEAFQRADVEPALAPAPNDAQEEQGQPQSIPEKLEATGPETELKDADMAMNEKEDQKDGNDKSTERDQIDKEAPSGYGDNGHPAHHDGDDDGGEIVEDTEDTVEY